MARDIMMNIGNGDLLINDRSNQNEPCFVSEWEADNLKIFIPLSFFKRKNIDYKNPSDFSFRCNIPFKSNPYDYEFFHISVYADSESVCEGIASARIGDGQLSMISPRYLPLIDIDGEFSIHYKAESELKMVVTSAKITDFTLGDSDNQVAQLLSLCAPGKYYRYPTTGIDITKYINTAVVNTDLAMVTTEQFDADGMSIQEMSFDSSTGNMKMLFNGGSVETDDNLLSVQALDYQAIDITDEMIEEAGKNIDLDFISEYNDLLPENLNIQIQEASSVDEYVYDWFSSDGWFGDEPW